MTTNIHAVPGTNSTAVQAPDGTWTVLDIPLCHEGAIERFDATGKPVDVFSLDRAWMRRAIQVAAMKEAEGYMGRVFLDHHEPDAKDSQPDAGFPRPRTIRTIRVNGKAVAALCGDLVAIPDEVYRTYIRTRRLPYRSIESLNAESGFIDGVALMATRSPHYHVPILTIAREIPYRPGADAPDSSIINGAVAVACASSRHAIAALRRRGMSLIQAKSSEETEGAEQGTDAAEAGASEACELVCELIASGEITVADFLAIREAMHAKEAEAGMTHDDLADAAATEPPVLEGGASTLSDGDMGAAPAEHPPVDDEKEITMSAGARTPAAIRARARADRLQGRVAALEAVEARRSAIARARVALEGFELGEDPGVVAAREYDAGGAVGLATYLKAIQAHGRRALTNSDDDLTGGLESHSVELPPEVAAVAKTPAQVKAGLQAFRRFTKQAQLGFPMDRRNLAATVRRAVAAVTE